jgi:hypothetical protein
MTIISNPVKYNTGAGVGGQTGASVTIGGAGSGYISSGAVTTSSITLTNTSATGFPAGQIYTTTGTGNSWITPNNYDQVLTVSTGKSQPTLDVKGNLVINGVDLEERLKTIEKVLQIPERDVKLEKKHPKLKKLYDEYINALGKYRTFETIKGEDDGTT